MKTFAKWIVIFFVVGIGGFALYTWGTLKYVYSNGERAGYVQKFSKKGWIFKTWEGELAMVNLPGAMPQIFMFSVRDPHVAQELQKTMGNRVVLHYEEHKGIPLPVFGDTPYFITDVRLADAASTPATPAAPAPPTPAQPRQQ